MLAKTQIWDLSVCHQRSWCSKSALLIEGAGLSHRPKAWLPTEALKAEWSIQQEYQTTAKKGIRILLRALVLDMCVLVTEESAWKLVGVFNSRPWKNIFRKMLTPSFLFFACETDPWLCLMRQGLSKGKQGRRGEKTVLSLLNLYFALHYVLALSVWLRVLGVINVQRPRQ